MRQTMPEYQLRPVHPSVFRFIFMSNNFRSTCDSFSQTTFMISNSASGSFRDSFMFLSLPSTNILHLSKMIVNLILGICLICFVSFYPLAYKHASVFHAEKNCTGESAAFSPVKTGEGFHRDHNYYL